MQDQNYEVFSASLSREGALDPPDLLESRGPLLESLNPGETRAREVWEGFIVFEGLDGAGTTTQCRLLSEVLTRKKIPHWSTREPTDNPFGQLARRILRKEIECRAKSLALLFTADRQEHVFDSDDGIRTRLADGEIVLCDRYFFSTMAYQSLSCSSEELQMLCRPFPLPEYLFFLDVDEETAMKRIRRRQGSAPELFEQEVRLREIRRCYHRTLQLFEESDMRIHWLDAARPLEEILEEVQHCLALRPEKKQSCLPF